MHFSCRCGYVFYDNTDNLRFKGHITADQDMDELDYSAEHFHSSQNLFLDVLCNMRTIYQCPHCGMIFIDNDDGGASAFVPAEYVDMEHVAEKVKMLPDDNYSKNCRLLQSAKGELWKGSVCAEWNDEKRDWEDTPCRTIFIELNTHEYDDYRKEHYNSLEEMKADYLKLVKVLSEKELIRYSLFTVNGKSVNELCRRY